MTYEFITTGDAITFSTDSDKIAFACTVMLGHGKAGCKRYEGKVEVDIDGTVAATADPNRAIESRLGSSLNQFLKDNTTEMVKCFNSFAYGTKEQRPQYDQALEALKDPVKWLEYRAKHESDNRTSLTTWVIGAWELGEAIQKQF